MHVKRRFTAAVVAAGGLLLLAVFIGVQQFHSVNRDEIGREHFFSPEKPARLGIRSREETQAVALQAILENKTVLVVLVREEERHCPAAPGPAAGGGLPAGGMNRAPSKRRQAGKK